MPKLTIEQIDRLMTEDDLELRDFEPPLWIPPIHEYTRGRTLRYLDQFEKTP